MDDKNLVKIETDDIELKINNINSNTKNLIFVDSLISQNEIFFNSINSKTGSIKYNNLNTKIMLMDLLTNFDIKTIDRVAFIFDELNIIDKKFLDNCPFYTADDLLNHQNDFSENFKFILNLIDTYQIKTIDFLACNSLTYSNWNKYFQLLTNLKNIKVGASNDFTGNIKYGGNWILESTGEDVQKIYWSNEIETYSSLLSTTTISQSGTLYFRQTSITSKIEYSNDNTNWISIGNNWPIQINNSDVQNSTLIVSLITDITISSTSVGTGSNGYIIIGTDNIKINGNNYNLTINNITNYPGLIQNGNDGNNGKSYITVENIKMLCSTSSLSIYNGWFGGRFYSKGAIENYLSNLTSDGNMSLANTGGILGLQSGIDSGYITLSNCNTFGEMIGRGSGGIISKQAGENNGTVIVKNCYTVGKISGFFSGGIVGPVAGFNGGNIKILNCYSSGNINAYCGGIIGSQASQLNGKILISNCYTTGNIIESYAGCIAGPLTGFNGGIVTIEKCYSTGNISGINSGGIVGAEVGLNDIAAYVPQIKIINCFSLGALSNNSGSICGGTENSIYTNIPNITIDNCYGLNEPLISPNLQIINSITINNSGYGNGVWSDSTALLYLTGTPIYKNKILKSPIGDTWADIDSTNNTIPWIFSTFRFSPYTSLLVDSYNQRIKQGQFTIPALSPSGFTFNIVAINNELPSKYPNINIIQSNNLIGGQINTNLQTIPGSYKLKILQQPNYTMTNFILNIIVVCYLETTKILCLNKFNQEEYIQIKNIKKDMKIKTYLHGYKKVLHINKTEFQNTELNTSNKLYVLKKDKNINLFEDLYITGKHCILIDKQTEKEKKKTLHAWKSIRKVDDKELLMASISDDFESVDDYNKYTLYHLVLESQDVNKQFGIYANGILSETMSINIFNQSLLCSSD